MLLLLLCLPFQELLPLISAPLLLPPLAFHSRPQLPATPLGLHPPSPLFLLPDSVCFLQSALVLSFLPMDAPAILPLYFLLPLAKSCSNSQSTLRVSFLDVHAQLQSLSEASNYRAERYQLLKICSLLASEPVFHKQKHETSHIG